MEATIVRDRSCGEEDGLFGLILFLDIFESCENDCAFVVRVQISVSFFIDVNGVISIDSAYRFTVAVYILTAKFRFCLEGEGLGGGVIVLLEVEINILKPGVF